jgi:hypothetical protein
MKREWQPTKLEREIEAKSRSCALRELMRVPWSRFSEAQKEYIKWESFALWAGAIVESRGHIPSWLAVVVEERCRGFTERRLQNEPQLLSLYLDKWIQDKVFDEAKRQGWLSALVFFGVRDPEYQGTWEYYEHCKEVWKRRQPMSYPAFEQWRQRTRAHKLHRMVSVAKITGVLQKYVEWQAFRHWSRALPAEVTESHSRVVAELKRAFPQWVEENWITGSQPLKHDDLLAKCEKAIFSVAEQSGWFHHVVQESHLHPRHLRTVQYSDRSIKACSRTSYHHNPYPSFRRWRRAADDYVELLDETIEDAV